MNKLRTRIISLIVALIALSQICAACDATTQTASCAFIVGNGVAPSDTKLHKTIYPGQIISLSGENATYVPCNSRNFIVNDGSVKDANGAVVGDRTQLITATTRTSVSITVAVTALWTLNENQGSMAKFYTVCFKYTCASTSDKGGDANFSTKGWNGMLAENFGPAMEIAARVAAIEVDDTIWQQHNPTQYKALADKMSEKFADAVRANLGFSEDLFCGSGNSQWPSPDKPGVGEFTCSPVRFVVSDVQQAKSKADDNTEGATSLNAQRFKNAEALYGSNAAYWLGLQDTIEKCKASGSTCVFNIGGAGSIPVSVPVTSPIPTPAPAGTPVPAKQ